MNKILEYTYCKCNDDDTILRIVAGNDFTLRLQLTEKNGELIVPYDLSDAEDLIVNVVTPDGDRIELDSYIDNNIVFAVVDAQQLGTYTPYGIEVIWFDEPYDKRAAAPNLFCFVNSSREANDAQDIIIEGPYDYNLEILSDIAYVSVGEIPEIDLSDYYTKTEIDTTLSSYVQLTELQNMSYATKQYVDDSISHIDLTNYYTKSEADTLMSAYLEYDEFENYAYTISYAANDLNSRVSYLETHDKPIDLSSYVTYDYLSSMAYVQQSHLYDNIYTKGEVDNKVAIERNYVNSNYYNRYETGVVLKSYVNAAQYDSTNHNILLQNGTTTIATIDASPFIIDGMVENVVVSNGNLVISFNTDAGKQDITIPISQIFDASLYYTKTEIDTTLGSYVKIVDLQAMSYVSHPALEAMGYLIQADIDAMGYVTYTDWDSSNEAVAYFITNQTLFNTNLYTKNDINTILSSYLKQSELNAQLDNYVTVGDNENQNQAIAYAISYLEQNGGSGGGGGDLSNYVTKSELEGMSYVTRPALEAMSYLRQADIDAMSYVNHTELNNASYVSSTDADDIVLLTQSEYDTLVNDDDVNPDTLYYITDATSNYVTTSELNTAIAGVTIDETNLVHKTGAETISGAKTFSANNTFNGDNTLSGETKFIFSSRGLNYTDNLSGISKSSLFARGSFNQACIGQILAPNSAVTDSNNKYDNQVNTILFQKVNGNTGSPYYRPTSLTQLAKIDTNGIYEGDTLLSNKYVASASVRTILQITQSDYDTLVNNSQVDPNTMYVIIN